MPAIRRLALATVVTALTAGASVAGQTVQAATAPVAPARMSSVDAAGIVPALDDVATTPHRMAQIAQRFLHDLDSVEHVHDVRWGSRREAALRALFTGWQARLALIDYDTLGLEDRIDWQLLSRELDGRLSQLEFERARFVQAERLLPGITPLLELAEARRNLESINARDSAGILERSRSSLKDALDQLRKPLKSATPLPTAAVANRAASIVDGTRQQLKGWYGFRADYDPQFTWWAKQPYEALDQLLGEYADAVRKELADASNPETVIGDPIGRDAIVRLLAHELIDYSPEELLRIGEIELAWCQREMQAAAREMGFDDWRAALEAVKHKHVEPGAQPALVVQLADEAINYVTTNNLVTVPELARHDWRMTMLDPQAQLQAPFFLGGTDVWVAYPTAAMPFDKKLNSLRGNNRHFSRAVVHHELIPGHHLQHFMTTRYQPHRADLSRTPFWGEGWALYWEFLLYERGFAQSPEDRIGMLFWRSHRAARILFSLGFHLGKLSPQQAIDLLVERVGHERENATGEVRRSFAGDYGPLYQVAYMLGGLQFDALRTELVDSGNMTDLEFHDRILHGGPMPVELVRARLTNTLPPKAMQASWKFYDFERNGD